MAVTFTFNPFTGNFDAINGSASSGVITPWANDLTFTPSPGYGTTSSVDIWYRRVGDSMQVRGSFLMGSPSATVSYLQMPTAHTIDVSKVPSGVTAKIGLGAGLSASGTPISFTNASGNQYFVIVDTTVTNQAFFCFASVSSVYRKDMPSTFGLGSGDLLTFEFDVPILEWA